MRHGKINIASLVLFVCVLGLAPASAQSGDPLQPYILVGESGKSVARTTKDILSHLFMGNYRIVGRYHPGDREDLEVILVTHPSLLGAVALGPPDAMLASICRISVQAKGSLTFVSLQNLPYWARAFYGSSYPAVATAIEAFTQSLLNTLPSFRGSFNRYDGGDSQNSMTIEKLRAYRYRRRSEGLDDAVVLARYAHQSVAVEAVQAALAAAPGMHKVFELPSPQGDTHLFGVDIPGTEGDLAMLEIMGSRDRPAVASLPYEILVSGGIVTMLPLRYRLPLSAPAMDRKTFRRLKKFARDWEARFAAIFDGGKS